MSNAICRANMDAWDAVAQERAALDAGAPWNELPSCVLQLLDSTKSIVHLACGAGAQTLALRERCLSALGVDISKEQIHLASQRAAQSSMPVDFCRQDVCDSRLPAAIGRRFDIVYTGQGALPWVYDLDTWSRNLAALLAPSGKVVVFDSHPVTSALRLSPRGGLEVRFPVSGGGRPRHLSGPWTHFPHVDGLGRYVFDWSISDVISAWRRAGLLLEGLQELYDGPELSRFRADPAQVRGLPLRILLVGTTPAHSTHVPNGAG